MTTRVPYIPDRSGEAAAFAAHREKHVAAIAQKQLRGDAIKDAARRCRDGLTEDALENLAASVAAAKVFCEGLGPIVKKFSRVPRELGYSSGAYISLPTLLVQGYLDLKLQEGTPAPWDALERVNYKHTFVTNPLRHAVEELIATPTADTARVAVVALETWASCLDVLGGRIYGKLRTERPVDHYARFEPRPFDVAALNEKLCELVYKGRRI